MDNRPPNLPSRTLFFPVLVMGSLLSSDGIAAPGTFIPDHILGRNMLCATLLPEHEYSFIPPLHGHLIRLGTNTLCYISDENVPEELYFVETDTTGLLIDAGTIPLPTFQE